jgi:type IV pilus assembly protein PilX
MMPKIPEKSATLHPHLQSIGRSHGAALFISLILLLVITLLGLTSSNVSILQERMAGNVRESNIALQRAEATLREIESQLDAAIFGSGPAFNDWGDIAGTDLNDCNLDEIYAGDWGSAPWQTEATTGNEFFLVNLGGSSCLPPDAGGTIDTSAGPGGSPGAAGGFNFYIVTARAFSSDDTDNERRAEAIVQSIYYRGP